MKHYTIDTHTERDKNRILLMLETIKREEEKESSKENNKNNKQTKINKPKQLANSIQSKKMHFELKISFLKLGCLFYFILCLERFETDSDY